MKRFAMLAPAMAIVTVLGCSDKGDDTGNGGTGDGGSGDGGSGECTVSVDSTWPIDGETDAYYRTQVEFDLSGADPTGTPSISLTDAGGTAVAGTQALSDDGKTVYFYPSAPLANATSYTASLTYCGGNPSISFTTGNLGGALTADLAGKGYIVDLNNARFVEPAGVASLLLGELNNNILLGVESASGTSLEMIGAISVEGGTAQDVCEESIDFPTVDFSQSPYFELPPTDTTISAAGYDITISQLSVSGTFAADGSYFGGGVLAGELDARVLAPLVGELVGSEDPDDICALLVGFGVECMECASDGAPYCVAVLVEDLTAVEGDGLQVVTAADVAGNPSCTE